MRIFCLIYISFILISCQPTSLEDFRAEGDGIIQSIIAELKPVRTSEQLEKKKIILKKLFNKLIDVIIAAHEFQAKQTQASRDFYANDNSILSDLLRAELNRLCRIEGARQVLEKAQDESLNRLDTHLNRYKGSKAYRLKP